MFLGEIPLVVDQGRYIKKQNELQLHPYFTR